MRRTRSTISLQTLPPRLQGLEGDSNGAARAGGFSLHAGLELEPAQREQLLDLMARLAALVPPPRMHLTRDHGVFAPHSKLKAAITPAHRGTGASKRTALAAVSGKPPTPRHVAMSWAQRLKRVFGIEIDSCARCGGKLEVIASIEEPEVIAKSLAPLEKAAPDQPQVERPLGARAPPPPGSLL